MDSRVAPATGLGGAAEAREGAGDQGPDHRGRAGHLEARRKPMVTMVTGPCTGLWLHSAVSAHGLETDGKTHA